MEILLDEELAALRQGTLQLLCSKMQIQDNGGDCTYSGPGYIRQADSTGFEFTIFVTGPNNGVLYLMRKNVNTQSGTILRNQYSWSLTATDLRGRTWKGMSSGHPAPSSRDGEPCFALVGSCYELIARSGQTSSAKNIEIEMRTFARFDFPKNQVSKTTIDFGGEAQHRSSVLNAAKFSSGEFEFSIYDTDDQIRLRATSDSACLHPFFETRIEEAFLFALDVSVVWEVCERFEKGVTALRMRSGRSPKNADPHPPIGIRGPFDETEQIWKLFELFLNFISPHMKDEYHPLSAQLHAIHSARKSSIQVYALTLATAIESVLKCFFSQVGEQPTTVLADIDFLIDYVAKCNIAEIGQSDMDAARQKDIEIVKKRANDVLGNLKGTSAGNRLHALVSMKVVCEQNGQIWKKLRHSVAHGDWSRMDNMQTLLSDTGSLQVLLYQLIFHLIGHKGKQTDWGKVGWPLINYPPQSPPPNTNIATGGC